MASQQPQPSARIGLFVTCLVDLFRPAVGFAAVKLLEDAGFRVEVPEAQTCCGQPAYNSGDLADTRAIARQVIAAFEPFDYVVTPSGSCGGQLHKYPELFADTPDWQRRAQALASRTHELLSFLTDIAGVETTGARFNHTATYHDSCSGLRQLGVRAQPRRLLAGVAGLDLREMAETEVCCGFGGTFCVKYPEISERMVSNKVANIEATGADTVLGGDLGCLMNIAGRLSRLGRPVKAYHTAEVLAGMADGPAIGESDRQS
jgi:L-lactate dehydrogenase complex protein LldE